MRLIANVFLVVISFIINSTLFEAINLNGVRPDLFIVIIVTVAILRNGSEGALFGFFLGLMQDIFFGNILGFFALIYAVTGYLCGKPFKYIYRENYLVPMILVFVATIFFEVATFFCVVHSLKMFFPALIKIILPKCVYNVCVILFVYPLLYFVNNKLETKENKNIYGF